MKYMKIIAITLVGSVLVLGVFIMIYNLKEKSERERNSNFHKEAIEKFWGNEDLYEQVKAQFLVLSDDLTSHTFYFDSTSGKFIAAYGNFTISDDLQKCLLDLFHGLEPMSVRIIYGERIAKSIKFELDGGIRRKGIVYTANSSEEEIKNQTWISSYQYLKNNWYYYEEMAGT